MRFKDQIEQEGYVKYQGAVAESVYQMFRCPHAHKGLWYVKEEAGVCQYQCVGCALQCATDDDTGFQRSFFPSPSGG